MKDDQYNQPDPLYADAVEHVREENRASVSFIQRRLTIGYNRAYRLIEQMEKEGVITSIRADGGRSVIKA